MSVYKNGAVNNEVPWLKAGDIPNGNYLEIEPDGTDVRKGDSTMWDDLLGSLIGKRLSSTSGKVDYNWDENAITFQSGGNIGTSADRVIFNYQKPHAVKESSEMRLHIHYEQVNTNIIEFTTQYRIQPNGGAKTTDWTTVTRNTTNDNVFTYVSGTLNQIMRLAEIDLSGVGISSTVQFRLVRSDSTSGDVLGTFIDAHVEYDTLGSRTEYSK